MIVIGFHGPMQSGKDTGSEFIHEWAHEHGVFAVRRGFADLLKFSLYRIFFPDIGMKEAVRTCNIDKFEEMFVALENKMGQGVHVPIRQVLQRYGTEAHREVFGYDFWLDQILPRDELARIKAIMRHDDSNRYPAIVTITDTRFDNEAQRILDVGGEVWRIVRPDLELKDKHISEAILPPQLVTRVLNNHRDLAEYREHIRCICDELHAAGRFTYEHEE